MDEHEEGSGSSSDSENLSHAPEPVEPLTRNEGCGDGNVELISNRINSNPRPVSLQGYLRRRQTTNKTQDENLSLQEEDFNRSIEIFFGNLTNFGTFCNSTNGKGSKKSEDLNGNELVDSTTTTPPDVTTSNKKETTTSHPHQLSLYDFARPVAVLSLNDDYSKNFGLKSSDSYESVKSKSSDGNIEDKQHVDGDSSDSSTEYAYESESDVGNLVEDKNAVLQTRPSRPDSESEPEFEAIPNPLNTTVDPCAVKKLCLVGHPLTSFKGLNSFKKLHEAWITNCNIKDLRWQDFKSLKLLHRLYLFGGQITTIEPLHFENLRVLWLSNNKLTSLNFLTFGMQHLAELNVANNQITCLEAEDLYKCVSLHNFNVAGNPLCSIQDVECVNVVPTVKEFFLTDPGYGKCPVASVCESRAILVSKLPHVTNLNGKNVTDTERANVKGYIRRRILYYYASTAAWGGSHSKMRKTAVQNAFKQLESLGVRIGELATWSAKCLQGDFQMTGMTVFAKSKQQLLVEVGKIHTRLSNLKHWTKTVLRRIETILRISRWEQEMDEWMKLVELKSFGTIQAYIAHSVLDPEATKDKENIRSTLHQLFSSLACNKSWPRSSTVKLETIIVIRDKGAETGMEKIFEDNFARKNEPKFIPPPLDEFQNADVLQQLPNGHQFYGPPVLQPYKIVPTYVDPTYRPPPPVFPYPESVPGLPERSQPLLLFLICRTSTGRLKNDSLHYFHNLLFEKSRYYKDVRLTNCMWLAAQLASSMENSNNRTKESSHSVLFVVKVLEECLIPVFNAKHNQSFKRHSDDCIIFGLRRPLCYTPAYIVFVSHIPNDKGTLWHERVLDDSDVTLEAENILTSAYNRMMELGVAMSKKHAPYYLHRTRDGIKADLTAVTNVLSSPKNPDLLKPKNGTDLLNMSKFLGAGVAETITSLDLSANRLGLAVGLEGLVSLRKLNLSYNNLTTLSGLHKLPQLKELKTGWNSLRFFHSNLNTLVWACSKLLVLELLPNPFQDIRDYSHIPVLAHDCLPLLKRVDAWIAPFKPPERCPISIADELSCISNFFCKEILERTWVGGNIIYMDYKGRCLSNLDILPLFPYHHDSHSIQRNGVLLNLSDNYLTSLSLSTSSLVQNVEWKTFLVKLELQENAITSLEWLGNTSFPSLRIMNLSNNQLSEVDLLESACPNLLHLQIAANPIPCNLALLHPLRNLEQLVTLDAARTPLATHPDYASYVLKYLTTVQILDGVGVSDWNTEEAVNSLGGVMSYDWLENHIGTRNWNHLTELSLPNCGLQKVEFPSGSLAKLLSLDLSGNCLTSLAGLSALPRLRVLCVTNNRISSLGDSCPCCYEKTAESQNTNKNQLVYQLQQRAGNPDRQRFPMSELFAASKSTPKYGHPSSHITYNGDPISGGSARKMSTDISNIIFPKLEVLVLAHNGLSSVEDLHLHSLPSLRTVLLNCNKIKGFEGLSNLTSLRAIVLDNNHISHVPFSSMSGCSSLKYMHLEHNRMTTLPRFPNVRNLAALHIAYNRIQSLTDIGTLAQLEIQELTLLGNPSCKADYWKNIVTELPDLQKLDGVNILQLKHLNECDKRKVESHQESSDDWEDLEDLPPGFIPDGGLKVRALSNTFLTSSNINNTCDE